MLKISLRQTQFLIYVMGGVLSAALDIGAMQLLIAGGMPTIPATTLAFAAGLLFNYAYHARVTFSQPGKSGSFARYLCVVAFNYALTIALVSAGEHLLGSALAGKIVSLPLIAAIGYLLGKYWIFK